MKFSRNSLLLKFRARDTQFGVTRNTLVAMATVLDVSETEVVHMALSKFAADILPAYAPDDGLLTSKQIAAIKGLAAQHLPSGKVLACNKLFT